MDETTTRFEVLRERQSDVLHRAQLAACKVTPGRVQAQLDARRWQAVGPLVVVLHNGPLTTAQQTWAAVLSAGTPAALAGRTAAAAAGLTGWDRNVIEIVVPRGAKMPALPFAVKVHESRRFGPRHVHPAAQPPRVRLERAVIDTAAWTTQPRAACGVVAAAVQQRLTTASRLQSELGRAGRIRHVRVLRAVLQDIGGGAQALSEVDFGRLCRRNHLPSPARQVVRLDGAGRRRYLDAQLVAPNGTTLHVEVDGALHLLVASYWDDMHRGNELVIGGDRVLRFPSIALHLDEQRVVDQLRRGLGLTASRELSERHRAQAA